MAVGGIQGQVRAEELMRVEGVGPVDNALPKHLQ